MVTLADRIREARQGLGLTQGQLAEALGLSRPTVTQYESGRREPDNVDLLNKIADVLGVTSDWLIGRSEDPIPAQPEPPDPEIRAIRRSLEGLTEEERQDILDYIAWKRAQHQKKQQERNQKGEQDAL